MISPRNRRLAITTLLLRVVLGAVFVYAAYLKLKAPWQLFAGAIGDYNVLPDWAVIPLARTLPWAELVLGILLIAGIWLRFMSIASTLLLGAFFTLMVRAFVKGMDISCGCFGPSGDPISWHTLVRDGIFLAIAMGLTVLSFVQKRESRYGYGAGRRSPAYTSGSGSSYGD